MKNYFALFVFSLFINFSTIASSLHGDIIVANNSSLTDSILKMDSLAHYFETKGDYKQAFQYFEQYKKWSDSLIQLKNEQYIERNKINNANLQKENLTYEKKMKDGALLRQKKEFNALQSEYIIRYWVLALLAIVLLTEMFFYLYLRKEKKVLKLLNERLLQENNLFSKSPLVVLQLSVSDDFKFEYVSENIVDMVGLKSIDLINGNQKFYDLFEESLLTKSQLNENLSKMKEYFNFDDQLICAKGKYKHVTVFFNVTYRSNKPISFIGYIVDLSETHQLINELQQTRNNLDNTNETAKTGGWSVDLNTQEVSWTNYTYKVHEVPMDFVLDFENGINFFKEGEDRGKVVHLFNTLKNFGQSFDVEVKLITAKGNEIWVRLTGEPIYEKEKMVRLDGVIQDISELKNRELVLRKAVDLASEQNKKLQNFTHIVSHNLRSNAGNFEVLIDLLKDENDPEQNLFLMESLFSNSDRLHETLSNLNEIIQIQDSSNQKLKTIVIKKEINKILGGVSGLIKDTNTEVFLNFEDDLSIAFVPAYFESIFQNLITNAIKYRYPDRDPVITINYQFKDEFLILEIKDNGLGIDLKKYGEKVFGMYKTFHRNDDARGIGLYITKNQIEAMGGKIEIESMPDIGTTFFVYLKCEKPTLNKFIEQTNVI